MSARQARFEIVRTEAGWHARFRATNGRIVWWTENYTRRRAAVFAVWAVAETFGGHIHGNEVRAHGTPSSLAVRAAWLRDVDERATP